MDGKLLDDVRQRRVALEAQLPVIQARAQNALALKEGEKAAAEQQVAHLQAETRSLEARHAIARQQHRRGQNLRSRGALSESDAMEFADRVEMLSALIAAPRRELVRLQTCLRSHQEQVHRLELVPRQEENAVLERIHALSMEESRLRARESGIVLAPRAGRVASVRAGPGDWVAPCDALQDIVPTDAELRARLFVSSVGTGAIEMGQADLEQVRRVAALACIHEDIEQMPMGYHTLVGPMGSTLSGGQRQRVMIARALYRRPALLLMDEGTAHLDEDLQRQVIDNLVGTGTTIIAVTHDELVLTRANRQIRLGD